MTNEPRIDFISKVLADEHMRDDASMRRVYRVEHATEIRLLEVTDSVPATGEILPFRFAADPPDVPFESLVVLLHSTDWDRRDELVWPLELDPRLNALELIADWPKGGLTVCRDCWAGEVTTLGISNPRRCDVCLERRQCSYATFEQVTTAAQSDLNLRRALFRKKSEGCATEELLRHWRENGIAHLEIRSPREVLDICIAQLEQALLRQ